LDANIANVNQQWADENCPFNNARCASIKSANAEKGADTIKKY
jgi:hypothetical protein